MSASQYSAGTRVAYFNPYEDKVVEDEILLVRQGYYHMPSDDYLHDENIIGAIVDGKRIVNRLFNKDRDDTIKRAQLELQAAAYWAVGTASEPDVDDQQKTFAHKTEDELQIQDLAMIVRKLLKHVPDNVEFKAQAKEYLVRKGLTGNVLRNEV